MASRDDEISRLRRKVSDQDEEIERLRERKFKQAEIYNRALDDLQKAHDVHRAQYEETIGELREEIKSLREAQTSGPLELIERFKEELTYQQEMYKAKGKRRSEVVLEPNSPKRQETEPPEISGPDSDRPIETLSPGRRGTYSRPGSDVEATSVLDPRSATTPRVDDARGPANASPDPISQYPLVHPTLQDQAVVVTQTDPEPSMVPGSVVALQDHAFSVWIENDTIRTDGYTSTQGWLNLKEAWKIQNKSFKDRAWDWLRKDVLKKETPYCVGSFLISRAHSKWTRSKQGQLCCMTCFNAQRLCVKYDPEEQRFKLLPLPPGQNRQRGSPGIRTYLWHDKARARFVDPDYQIWPNQDDVATLKS